MLNMISSVCVKQAFSLMGVQASWTAIFYRKAFHFSYVALQIAHLGRPYSTFWMATFQILAKSLFVYICTQSANSTHMISMTKFYTGVII